MLSWRFFWWKMRESKGHLRGCWCRWCTIRRKHEWEERTKERMGVTA